MFEVVEFIVSFPSEWTEEKSFDYISPGWRRDNESSTSVEINRIIPTKFKNFRCIFPHFMGEPSTEYARVKVPSRLERSGFVIWSFSPYIELIGETKEPMGLWRSQYKGVENPTPEIIMDTYFPCHGGKLPVKFLTAEQLPKGSVHKPSLF